MSAAGLVGTIILLITVVLLVKKGIREAVASWFALGISGPMILAWALTVFILFFGCLIKTLSVGEILTIVFYFSAPAAVILFANAKIGEEGKAMKGFINLVLVMLFWLPVEFRFVSKALQDENGGAYPLVVGSAMVFALIAFTAWRKMDFNLDLSFKLKDLAMAGGLFFAILVVILPVSLWLEFTRFGVAKRINLWPIYLIAIWFAPALAEEIIFRGIIQNVLVGWFKPVIGIALASFIFGFAHINNGAGIYKTPNYVYIALATIVGAAYGVAYYKRNLQTSATLHWAVDFTWWLLFKGGK